MTASLPYEHQTVRAAQARPLQETARTLERTLVRLARQDVNTFNAYVLRDEKTGKPIRQADYHEGMQRACDENDRLVLWAHVEAGKCLAPDTLVMRADGHLIRAADVAPGDQLMGPDSFPRRVLRATNGRSPMYRIVPNRGASWECNDVHVLTLVHTVTGAVEDVPLNEYLRKSAFWKSNYKLFQPGSVRFPMRDAPIVDPYFLGLWFGDGTKSLHNIGITKPDAEVEATCRDVAKSWGLAVTRTRPSKSCPTWRIVSSAPGRTNALLDAMRACVGDASAFPAAVLYGSLSVRRAFLAGLLDADGYLAKPGYYEIAQRRRPYADGICWIARSLGFRAVCQPKQVKGRTYWRVTLSGDATQLPMRIARKVSARKASGAKDPLRTGFRVEALGVGDYAGFTLDGDGRFLLGDCTVTHNSSQLTVGRGLFELGRDPSLRTVIVSATAKQSGKTCRAMARYIETSNPLRRVFPRLVPSEPWWPSQALTVERPFVSKDPSVQAIGVHGNILGARIDRAYLDDILSHENVRTEAQRNEVYDWFMSTISGRISETGRVYFVGQAWHPGDIMHRFEKEGWHAVRYPVVDAYGALAWPERWNQRRIDRFRKGYGMLEYNRQLLCIARDDAESRFKLDWIELCKERGDGLGTMHSLAEIPEGCAIYTGVDLAVQKHSGADLTVLFTVLVHPNGDRQVLNIESGRWAAGDIIAKIVSVYVRFGGIIIVENNGAQQYILDLTREVTAATVRPFTTGKNKAHPEFGVESLAAELEAGKWIIPNDGGVCEPEVDKWISGMLSYDPQKHTPDHVMAAWFAREGARSWERIMRGEDSGVRARIVG